MNSEKYNVVLDFIRDNLNVEMSLDCRGFTPKTKRGLQHFSCLRLKDEEQQSIYEGLLTHALAAETRCPGAGLTFFQRILKNYESSSSKLISCKSDVADLIACKGYRRDVTSILLELLEISTTSSKIALKKSSTNISYIEVSNGYTFEVKTLLKNNKCEFENAKIVCIDGYIESVAEIHRLLEDVSEKKVPCVLFVRGLSEDVLHTIKVNNDRMTMTLIPFVVPYDVENVNTIVDIAVASGTDVVSSLKGQLISNVDIASSGHVDVITIDSNTIRIKNTNPVVVNRVKDHLRLLHETLEEKPEISSKIYEKRIRSMSSECIDVCIPDDINFFSSSQQLDEGMRIINAIMSRRHDVDEAATFLLDAYNRTTKDVVRLFT